MLLTLKQSHDFSVGAQIVAGLVCVAVLASRTDVVFAREWWLLMIEVVVQCIQICTYVFALKSAPLRSRSILRYGDWFITTPLMLFTFAAFLDISHDRPCGMREEGLWQFAMSNRTSLIQITLANLGMLTAGYMAERCMISFASAFVLGFSFFALLFYTLWDAFARDAKGYVRLVYAALAVTWGLYGIAFALKSEHKNRAYNALDVVSKNAFAVFLAFRVATMS